MGFYVFYDVNVDNPPAKSESVIICGIQPLSLYTVCVFRATEELDVKTDSLHL